MQGDRKIMKNLNDGSWSLGWDFKRGTPKVLTIIKLSHSVPHMKPHLGAMVVVTWKLNRSAVHLEYEPNGTSFPQIQSLTMTFIYHIFITRFSNTFHKSTVISTQYNINKHNIKMQHEKQLRLTETSDWVGTVHNTGNLLDKWSRKNVHFFQNINKLIINSIHNFYITEKFHYTEPSLSSIFC